MQWSSQGNIDFKTAPWPSISAAAKDCVKKLLTMDPKLRPTAQQILEVHRAVAPSVSPLQAPSWDKPDSLRMSCVWCQRGLTCFRAVCAPAGCGL